MGKIAEALRSNLKSIAQSDARTLRELDQELSAATAAVGSENQAELTGLTEVKALLGNGALTKRRLLFLKAFAESMV